MSAADQVRFAFSHAPLRTTAYAVIDRIDGQKPGDQILDAAMALVAMTEACGVDPHEVIRAARKAVDETDSPFTHEITALRAYAAHEIARKPGAPTTARVNANA